MLLGASVSYAAESDFPGWSFAVIGSGAKAEIVYDKAYVQNGDAAMKITPETGEGEYVIYQNVTLVPGEKYTMSVNVRGKTRGVYVSADGEKLTVPNGTFNKYRALKKEWTAASDSAKLEIVVGGGTEQLYLDNLSLVKSGDTANLLKNADFEEGADRTPPAEVTDLSATEGIGSITVRWQDPADEDFDKVILTTYDSEDNKIGEPREIAKGIEKAEIDGLAEWTDYKFVLQTVDNTLANTSAGVIITAHSLGATYTASDYEYSSGVVSSEVENVTEDNFSAELVVLSYNADGTLQKVTSSGKIAIEKGEKRVVSAECEITAEAMPRFSFGTEFGYAFLKRQPQSGGIAYEERDNRGSCSGGGMRIAWCACGGSDNKILCAAK